MKWMHECCRIDTGSCWNAARELLQNSNMKLYGRLAAHHYNVQRNVEKIRQILYKRTNVQRNAEKIRQILYKQTNVRRNAEKIRQILYKVTNKTTINITTIIHEMGTFYDMEKRQDKTNTVQID